MNIDAFIKQNAGNDDEHDKAYATALKAVYEATKDLTKEELLFRQEYARSLYARDGNTHRNTALCVIIYELLKEKKC
jgi:hypothetical protein